MFWLPSMYLGIPSRNDHVTLQWKHGSPWRAALKGLSIEQAAALPGYAGAWGTSLRLASAPVKTRWFCHTSSRRVGKDL